MAGWHGLSGKLGKVYRGDKVGLPLDKTGQVILSKGNRSNKYKEV